VFTWFQLGAALEAERIGPDPAIAINWPLKQRGQVLKGERHQDAAPEANDR
jgi:hypothetical protein